jgi:hypothetical protein
VTTGRSTTLSTLPHLKCRRCLDRLRLAAIPTTTAMMARYFPKVGNKRAIFSGSFMSSPVLPTFVLNTSARLRMHKKWPRYYERKAADINYGGTGFGDPEAEMNRRKQDLAQEQERLEALRRELAEHT